MRRFLASLLAALVLLLSCSPCCEAGVAADETPVAVQKADGAQHDEDDCDDCSPFCGCFCCAAVLLPAVMPDLLPGLPAGLSGPVFCVCLPGLPAAVYLPIWQPPQLV